ncbi:DUF3244 domain-containing protein [Sphingobacterium gobiense]|uniref:DUF3244 domain-containing protein n=1 Tax=Sphingobacterium gobiense TaxID=1382456 RepID=A0A2S9JLN8_9SPHI|nr:DUF3244 domain-containing protein [Sphingobacterium gobiense]PRD54062.1 hypothetical protein C5749_11240 [Sphingobacterium gobiense]
MKKQILALLLCGGWMFSPITGSSWVDVNARNYVMSKSDKIDLKGDLPSTGIHSVNETLTAFLQEDLINVYFNRNVGVVAITIKDQSEVVVYSSTVNSQSGQVIIPITNLLSGTYTITFDNGNGSMWGEFEI